MNDHIFCTLCRIAVPSEQHRDHISDKRHKVWRKKGSPETVNPLKLSKLITYKESLCGECLCGGDNPILYSCEKCNTQLCDDCKYDHC